MSRFQALTNRVVDDELEIIRRGLGLAPNQKAELLREVTSLAAWVVRQAERGRSIEARRGDTVEELVHPTIERIRSRRDGIGGQRVMLSDVEVSRLAAVFERGYCPTPALRKVLTRLLGSPRRPPKLRWRRKAA